MFTVFIGHSEVGKTRLEGGDPPMGVAFGLVELVCEAGKESSYIEELGGEVDAAGVLAIRDNSELHVIRPNSTKLEGQSCCLSYYPELDECHFEVVGIPWETYEKLFPQHVASYYGPTTE